MLYRFSLFFLFLWYIRPQDWVTGLIGVNIVRPVMALWLVLWFLADSRSRTPVEGLLKTPHDWAMLVYFGYVAWTAPAGSDAVSGFLPLVVFYALTVQSLSNWRQVFGYLKFWNWMLLALALLGVLITYGIDLTGGQAYTDHNKGRLCLGTWMHNNPNALGHSVVVALPLSYMMFFWKSNLFKRVVIFPLCVFLIGFCAWETESKGAYVVGGVLLVLVFVIGRPKLVQITALGAAAVLGVSALSFLPRMEQMGNLRTDEGVQGRLLAWEHARSVTKTEPTGAGWKQFIAEVPWREGRNFMIILMNTHASHVKVAADLGVYGLFIYLAIIWTAMHTLLVFKARSEDQERCRRMAMILVMSYLVSGWMINREYHTEYFLMIAVAAAMHRLRLKEESLAQEQAQAVSPQTAGGVAVASRREPQMAASHADAPKQEPWLAEQGKRPEQRARPFWNRFGIVDFAVSLMATVGTLWLWDYIMKNL